MGYKKEWKVGDKVTRIIGGVIPMPMQIVKIAGKKLICSPVEDGRVINIEYEFDQELGIEIDERFGWGSATHVSGSYLKEIVG